jgi:hypothetical protein
MPDTAIGWVLYGDTEKDPEIELPVECSPTWADPEGPSVFEYLSIVGEIYVGRMRHVSPCP